MKKAKEILLLIGGILSIIAVVGIIVAGIVLIILGSPSFANFLQEAVENGSIKTDFADLDALRLFLTLMGTFVLFTATLPCACAIVSFIAKDKESKALYIACIVLGLLTSMYLTVIGGIIGILDTDKDGPDRQTAQYQ